MSSSTIAVKQAKITNPTNTTFDLDLILDVSGAGIFKSMVSFDGPIQTVWNSQQMFTLSNLPNFEIVGGNSVIESAQTVTLNDANTFADFTRELSSQQYVEWDLVGSVTVNWIGILIKNIQIKKTIRIEGQLVCLYMIERGGHGWFSSIQ